MSCLQRRGYPASRTLLQVDISLWCPAHGTNQPLGWRWLVTGHRLASVWSPGAHSLYKQPGDSQGHGCVSHASHLASENSSQRPPSASISQIHSTHLGSQEPQCPPSGSTSLLHIQTPTKLSRPAPGTHGPGVSQGGHCVPVSVLTADAQPQTPSLWVKSTMPSCYSWDPQMVPPQLGHSCRRGQKKTAVLFSNICHTWINNYILLKARKFGFRVSSPQSKGTTQFIWRADDALEGTCHWWNWRNLGTWIRSYIFIFVNLWQRCVFSSITNPDQVPYTPAMQDLRYFHITSSEPQIPPDTGDACHALKSIDVLGSLTS